MSKLAVTGFVLAIAVVAFLIIMDTRKVEEGEARTDYLAATWALNHADLMADQMRSLHNKEYPALAVDDDQVSPDSLEWLLNPREKVRSTPLYYVKVLATMNARVEGGVASIYLPFLLTIHPRKTEGRVVAHRAMIEEGIVEFTPATTSLRGNHGR